MPDSPDIQKLLARLDQLTEENRLLRDQVSLLQRRLYGPSSEKRSIEGHPELELGGAEDPTPEEDAADDEEKKQQRPARKKTRPRPKGIRTARLSADLPIREEVVIPDLVLAQPEAWREIDSPDITDRLELDPPSFFIQRTIYKKFARIDAPHLAPLTAPAPPRIISNGFLGEGMLAEILVGRALFSLPFYRQNLIYKVRAGVDIPASTMGENFASIGRFLQPVIDAMKTRLIAGKVIQADETPVTFLVAKAEGGGSAKGYLWVYRGLNGEIVFDWHTSRALRCLESFLGTDFEGTLQSDDYGVYHSYHKAALLDGRDVTLSGCLAHVRRKFDEAKNDRPELADWFLRQMGLLYGIEEELREHGCEFEVRARVRQRRAKSILASIEKAAIHQLQKPGTLPKSPLGKALSHCLGRMPALKVYLEDGRLEIDNNLVENAIRPTAVGKKNHLFFGHAESGIPAANIYSLVISCHKLGGNPQAYLKELIREVPKMTTRDDFAWWTPANWVARQKDKEPRQESVSAAA